MAGIQPSDGEEIKELSNEELALRVREGSAECFEELVRRFEGQLLKFLCHRGQTTHEAEDLLQDTFVRAYNKIEQYNSRWKFSTWLFTIAGRLACDQRRRPQKQSLDEVPEPSSKAENPLTIVSQEEEKENLWKLAAELLSEDQYTALWLRYSEDMSVKEVSRVMGKTQSNVKVLLFRGRSALAEQFGKTEGADRADWGQGVSAAGMGGG